MSRSPDARQASFAIFALTIYSALGSGCVLIGPDVSYLSNREILEVTSEAAAVTVDGDSFELVQAEILEDSIAFHYRGVAFPGDQAWILRFSEKSSEQDPVRLSDVYSLLPILQEGREGFRRVADDTDQREDATVCYVAYSFDSPVHDEDGKALAGRGLVATITCERSGKPVVYHVNLDNWGDRDKLDIEDLQPLLEPILGR